MAAAVEAAGGSCELIRFERTRDYDLIESIMTDGRLWPWLSDDFYPAPQNFACHRSEAVFYLLAYEGSELLGLFITHAINAVLWEVHHALLPSVWGARAHGVGLAFEAWLWEYTAAQTAIGFTPACNRLALKYARRHGMKECGRIPKAYQRGGELFDVFIFSKSRS